MTKDQNYKNYIWVLNFLRNKEIIFEASEFRFYIYKHRDIDIDLGNDKVIEILIEHGLLELDSGNWETGNKSFYINPDLDKVREKVEYLSSRIFLNISSIMSINRDYKISSILDN